jgi:tetratricopeptide (TPR) repeat protein
MKNHILQKQLTINFGIVFIGIIILLFFPALSSAQNPKITESYKTLIQQADQAFEAKDYKGALLLYEKASQDKPEYNYASDKIVEIKTILEAETNSKTQSSTQNKKNVSSYKTLVAQADYALKAKEYADALLFYEKAYETRPDYNYAPEKIDEINSILNASPESKAQLYENTVHKAESYYKQKDYQKANSEFQKAALIDSSAKLPKERLAQISSSYIDPDDMANFNLAISCGDKEVAMLDFDHAILFYKAALELHPRSKFVLSKIDDTKKQQAEYIAQKNQPSATVASAGKQLQSEKPHEGHTGNQNSSSLTPDMQIEKEITTVAAINSSTARELPDKNDKSFEQADQQKYDAALVSAENLLKSADYEGALTGFKSASTIKPSEAYPKQKISEVEGKLAELKSIDKNYTLTIADGDRYLFESKYSESLVAYNRALSIKPNEAYPTARIAEINSILVKQKSDSENYSQAIRTGEKAQAAGDYSLALTSFQDARKLRPTEQYPQEQINAIKALLADQQKNDKKYTTAINTGDKLFAGKDYSNARIAYSEASELKKNEKYPQDQISKIKIILADSRTADDSYKLTITEGDRFFAIKDYAEAKSAFVKASALKPAETYPRQRIIAIDKIIEEIAKARSTEYNTALEIADKLYNKKIFDQAIDAYEAAAKINPGDTYPELQIGKIRKYMSDHAILDLNSQAMIINNGNEKKFSFSAIDPGLRKNNYILLKARSTSKIAPKVYLNYGKDNTKNGGIVLRNLDKTTLRDFLISISIQDKWFREENNWISIAVETGGIEITKVQIAAGE